MQNLKIYMAGPIQHAHDRGKGWRERLKTAFPGVNWLDPLDKYDSTDDEGAEWTEEEIVANDKEMIRKADAMVLHYEKVPTWGTPRENEYATSVGVPVYVQTTEDEPSPWLTVDAEIVAETFEEVMDEISRNVELQLVLDDYEEAEI